MRTAKVLLLLLTMGMLATAPADSRATHVFQTVDSREPVQTGTSESYSCDGRTTFPIRLRGWIAYEGFDIDGEGEAKYAFYPDFDWARSAGVSVEKLYRVGQ